MNSKQWMRRIERALVMASGAALFGALLNMGMGIAVLCAIAGAVFGWVSFDLGGDNQ